MIDVVFTNYFVNILNISVLDHICSDHCTIKVILGLAQKILVWQYRFGNYDLLSEIFKESSYLMIPILI